MTNCQDIGWPRFRSLTGRKLTERRTRVYDTAGLGGGGFFLSSGRPLTYNYTARIEGANWRGNGTVKWFNATRHSTTQR